MRLAWNVLDLPRLWTLRTSTPLPPEGFRVPVAATPQNMPQMATGCTGKSYLVDLAEVGIMDGYININMNLYNHSKYNFLI